MGQQRLGLTSLQERGLGSCECHMAFTQMGYKLIFCLKGMWNFRSICLSKRKNWIFCCWWKVHIHSFFLCVHYPNGVSMIIFVVLKKFSLLGLLLLEDHFLHLETSLVSMVHTLGSRCSSLMFFSNLSSSFSSAHPALSSIRCLLLPNKLPPNLGALNIDHLFSFWVCGSAEQFCWSGLGSADLGWALISPQSAASSGRGWLG